MGFIVANASNTVIFGKVHTRLQHW